MPCGGFGWWWIRLSSSLCHPLPLWLGCSLCSLHNLQEMWCFALFLGGNAIEEQQHPTAIADWFKKMSKKMKAIVISCDTKLLDCKFPSARAVFHNSAHVCSCASYSTNVYCHWICASEWLASRATDVKLGALEKWTSFTVPWCNLCIPLVSCLTFACK